METNKNIIDEVAELWKTLCREGRNKKFKIDMFENAFAKTYAMLSAHVEDSSLDKQYIQLISEAYLFANINGSTLESTCLAASVLTERMLKSFAFSDSSNNAESSKVYLLETREEIKLDFNDINESLARLSRAYDNAFFKNL